MYGEAASRKLSEVFAFGLAKTTVCVKINRLTVLRLFNFLTYVIAAVCNFVK